MKAPRPSPSPSAQGRANLGVVTTSYPRESGDPAGNFVAGFARWLASQGWQVEVIAAGPGASVVDGIPVERVDGRGLFYAGGAPDALAASWRAWPRAARFTTELARAIARRAPGWQAVVSHWVVPSSLLVSALAPRLPHLAIAHSSDVTLLQRSKTAGAAALRTLCRRADLVYAAPHLVVDGAAGRVVAMGIDAASVTGGDRAAGRARFHLRERCTALFLGRLVPVKGLDLLLAALPDDLDLLIAGDGPLAAALARSPRGNVRLVGEVRGRDRADLLAAADLLVVPSRPLPDGRSEGTPTVIFEAQAAGLPVVATRVGGAASAISDGNDGLLVEPTVAALGAALRRLLADEPLRQRLASNGAHVGAARDWYHVGPHLGARLPTVSLRNLLRSA